MGAAESHTAKKQVNVDEAKAPRPRPVLYGSDSDPFDELTFLLRSLPTHATLTMSDGKALPAAAAGPPRAYHRKRSHQRRSSSPPS